jgi:hypothetical protein
MARPAKSDAEKRRVTSVRLSPVEHDALLSRASVSGLSLSEYLRLSALRRPQPSPARSPAAANTSFELIEQLRRVGVNLNQLTRLSHIDAVHHAELAAALTELRGLLALLMPPADLAGDTEH